MYARHVTLVASAVTTITMDADYGTVEILNVDGAAAVYISTDGSTPTVEGNNTLILPAAIGGIETSDATAVIKLISSGTPKVYVRGW